MSNVGDRPPMPAALGTLKMIIFSRILNRFMARKTKVSLSLTPEAVTVLDDLATQLSVSRSGLVEQLAQGHLAVKAPAAQQGAALMLGSKGVSVTPFDPSLDPPKGEDPPKGDPPKEDPPAAATALGEPPEEPSTEADAPAAHIPEGNTSPVADGAIASPPPAEPEMAGGADAPAADQPGEPTAAAGMAPVPPPEPPHPQADPVPALQSQLLAAIAAQDTLKAQAQAQAQELIQLRQELAQQRSLALLGERQINRWRYYTYSR